MFQLLVAILILYRLIFLRRELREYKTYIDDFNVTVMDGPPLPFSSYIPFRHDNGITYYGAIFFQVLGTWLFGVYIGSIDVILGGFLIHSKAQLLILKNYINLFAEKAEEMFVSFK